MSDPNGDADEGRKGRRPTTAGFSAARGAALVAIAVIIGIVLLQTIDDGNDGPVGDGGPASTTTTTTATSTSTDSSGSGSSTSSTTSKAAELPPAQVTVRVLNGSGVAGAAGTLTNTLKAKGYKTLVASDAATRSGTVVDAKTGRTAECTTLSGLVPNSKVQAMPTPVPGGQDADCIVIIGS
jgi:hypothetical protein